MSRFWEDPFLRERMQVKNAWHHVKSASSQISRLAAERKREHGPKDKLYQLLCKAANAVDKASVVVDEPLEMMRDEVNRGRKLAQQRGEETSSVHF